MKKGCARSWLRWELLCSERNLQLATAQITIDQINIGNPGNPDDSTGYGGVSCGYAIGKYEVTLTQYTAFLNAVAKTDTYNLYNPTFRSRRG